MMGRRNIKFMEKPGFKIYLIFLHRNYCSFLFENDICKTGFGFSLLVNTLESGINIGVRLLIFEVFSRGYVLIKGGYVYLFLIFKKLFKTF